MTEKKQKVIVIPGKGEAVQDIWNYEFIEKWTYAHKVTGEIIKVKWNKGAFRVL